MRTRPRYAASLDKLNSSPWELHPRELSAYFGQTVFSSDSFIFQLRKLADDFAKSYDWERVYSLLKDVSNSRRDPASTVPRVSRDRTWVPYDIAQVRRMLENEAMADSGVTAESEAVAPTAVSNGQVDAQDQVSSFIQHEQDLQDDDGTRGQHASEPKNTNDLDDSSFDDFDLDDWIHEDAINEDTIRGYAIGDDLHGRSIHNAEHDKRHWIPPGDRLVIEDSVTRRKRKQGGRKDSSKRARLDLALENVEEDLSSQDGEAMNEEGVEQDMDTNQLHARSDRDSPHHDANQTLAGADTDTLGESIEAGRGGSAHADLPDRMSDIEGNPLERYTNRNYFLGDSSSSVFQLSDGQPHQSLANIGLRTPLSKTQALPNRDDQTPAGTGKIEQTGKARHTGVPSVVTEPSTARQRRKEQARFDGVTDGIVSLTPGRNATTSRHASCATFNSPRSPSPGPGSQFRLRGEVPSVYSTPDEILNGAVFASAARRQEIHEPISQTPSHRMRQPGFGSSSSHRRPRNDRSLSPFADLGSRPVDSVPLVDRGRHIATDAATANGSTETQQHVLDQLAPLAYLDNTTMERILPFWLLPKSHHLKISTPPSWASFCLPRNWRIDAGDSRDIFVDLFRPTRRHWTLLRIEVDKAHVSVYDPLPTADPGLKEAAKAIVAAMGIDFQENKWSFEHEICPEQSDTQDCGVLVLLYAMHVATDNPLPSVAILDGSLWRMLFILLVRKSPLTTSEKTSFLTSTTAAPVAVEDLSSCQRLVRLHEKALAMVEILESKQASLDHAKRLLTAISRVFESFVNATVATTSHLARNQQFLEDLLARDCSEDRNLVEALEKANIRIEAELHNSRVYETRVSDLAFLLQQVDVLALECIEIQTASANEATVLVSTMKFEQAILFDRLQQYGVTDSL
ncbi:hypothetical protein D6D19_10506 [Aureobasidium pullulans]|uniref:Ubiquitin-like protease family profile domain-containing protein n=1 Tax=Aureobasidium pullulans TaxID=5580 RepID=A0A4V4IMC3_AURPU|nr:hypothetical protein D6D19_10506 [Aureobasidium pullulans]